MAFGLFDPVFFPWDLRPFLYMDRALW